ncbi:TPA_asm: GIY-YIG nuclease family protein, partial [Salmonella enterica subsp. enterica serovar Enteritidis str. P125109]|nr:GIY-YIG nuclease family protein [Salmonella enterica subsp. enterica serovar Enteritidis str. P125109]
MEVMFIFFVFFSVIVVALLVAYNDYETRKLKENIRTQIEDLASNTLEITPEEFFQMRNQSFGGKGRALYANKYNFEG